MKITSRDNQRLKFVRKVRDEKINDKIFIEGTRLAEEALRSELKIRESYFSNDFLSNERSKKLLKKIHSKKIENFEVSNKFFNTITATKNSQGIILIADLPMTGKKSVEENLRFSKADFPIILLLNQINNPSNLGAILRTAEAVGVKGIILTKNSTSPFSPKATRAAMGASFRLPIWKNSNFSDALKWAEKSGFTTICADINSEKNYLQAQYKQNTLFVFGSEAHGLTVDERDLIKEGVKIPLENDVESLNLAVACGIILFEAKRQQAEN